MLKKTLSLLAALFVISTIGAPVFADQTVFGPKDLTIGRWHFHLSSHRFNVNDPAPGVLSIVKNTPDKKIRGGFCFVNGKYIGLRSFLRGTGTVLEKDVQLRSKNRIFVFLRGARRASIKIEIRKKGTTPPPEVTLEADPATIYTGQSSTLSWTSTNADTCVIQPDIGSVDVNGSTAVSPTETTAYTITATGAGGTATASATVTLANSAPVAHDQTVSLNEDETAAVTLTASDADVDPLTYQLVSNPSHGTLTGQAPNLIYTPSSDYNGSDTFTFKASDGSLDSNTATVTLLIQPVNDPPTAADDAVTTDEDTAIATIAVLTNDSDPDGDTLFIDDFTQPTHGTAGSNGDGTLTYTPDENFNGTDSFTYTISDGNGGTDTATVNITVNPVNDAPVANSQSVTLNEDEAASITLTATDSDGDTLTYQVVSGPSHGTLTGIAPDITYTPADNYNGSDAFTFKANDGTTDSNEATVTITVNPVNDPPVADAGPDQTALQGNVVTLNGSSSSDIDGDTITYNWSFLSVPAGSTAALSDPSSVSPTFTADLIGTYEIQLVVNDGTVNSAPDTITVNVFVLPTVEISASPPTIISGESSTLTWTSMNADTCVIEPGVGSVALTGSTTVSPTETTTYTITATNPGGTATDSITITVDPPPTVNFSASPATIAQGGSSVLSWTSNGAQNAHIDNGIGTVNVNGSITVNPEHTTTYTISVTGPTGSVNVQATVKVTGNTEPQPDGSYGQQYEDLVPPDSTVDEYDPKRFSLITGIVHSIDDSPIQDVSITIYSHPEYGTILTDITGRFSIPVEGGSTMTVVYQKDGLITTHRKVYVPWNDIAIAETIQMIAKDPVSTTFTFDGNPDTVFIHQSSETINSLGTRSATLVFRGDNRAYLTDENGDDAQELTTISTRITEYTTPEAMPAKLPPNSAFTYCIELEVDGAQRVRFDNPVVVWVDNFFGFDVGMPIPVGTYNRDCGLWEPEDDGVVVKILDMDSDGIVDALDSDGDDQPNDLNSNGSFADEVEGLKDSAKSAPGITLWRVEHSHFSPGDYNIPPGFPDGADYPPRTNNPGSDSQGSDGEDPKRHICSYVEEKSRIFHEDIPIPGTDMALHYASDRVAGYTPGNLVIPASGDTVPEILERIVVKAEIAGRKYTVNLPPEPNQVAIIEWDGLDYLQRFPGSKVLINPGFRKPAAGTIVAHVKIGYVYKGVYRTPVANGRSFGQPGVSFLTIPTPVDLTRWTVIDIPIVRGKGTIAEGWTLSPHHLLSPQYPSLLFKGDGNLSNNNVMIIKTYAGNGTEGFSGDGGPATEAQMLQLSSLAVDSIGNLYIINNVNSGLRKVDTNGIITSEFFPGRATSVAIDQFDNLYATATYNQIYKRDVEGNWEHIAGVFDYSGGYSGDGGPATEAFLASPTELAIDTHGNVYIADYSNHRIRKIDQGGIITTVAGNGTGGHSGDGGLATEAQINVHGVAVDDSGNLYIGAMRYVRKVDVNGIITTYAGNGEYGATGDGGLAIDAALGSVCSLEIDVEGNLIIIDRDSHRVRKVDTNGIITTVAGTGPVGFHLGQYSGYNGPATAARFNRPYDVAIDAAGNLFIADSANYRVRKVSSPSVNLSGVMSDSEIAFTEEGGIGHIMSGAGYHQKTIDLNTGVVLKEFGYDSENNLISITDQFGEQVIIERNSSNVPTVIISPDGIRTELTLDANNHLTRITYPDDSQYGFEYTSDGLETRKTQPEGNQFGHVFDDKGRITDFTDDEGGHWQFSRTVLDNGNILHETATAESNLTTYLDHTESTGAFTSTITDPSGEQTIFTKSDDNLTKNSSLPCNIDLEFKYSLDSEYKFKYVKEIHETAPSGLAKIITREKTYEDTDSDEIKDLITETVSVNDNTTTLVDNVLQSEKIVTTSEGRTVITQYDPATLLTESVGIPGLNTTNYLYDPQGMLTSVSTGTRETTFTYNAQGFMDSFTDPEKHTTTYTHDAVGRVTGVGRPDGSSLGFTYDGNGNMTVLTNPSTIQHGFGFNKVNLNSSYQTPISGTYSYVYDRDRRLTGINFPSGRQITNIYDTIRLSQVQTPEGNIDYTYVCGSNVGSITKGTESIAYGYDGSLVTSVDLTGTLSQSLGYTYNNDFNVESFAYAGGTESYSYDNDGLLTGAGSFTITRNAQNGLPESINGGALIQSRTFNGYGEMDGNSTAVNSLGVGSWSLAQDDNGQITQKIETVDGTTSTYDYTYDPMGRLLTVTKDSSLVEEYDYDENGTRIYEMNTLRGITGRSFTYSDEDHLLTAGTASYQYDADGFLITRTDGTDVTGYTYSSRGELLSVTLADGKIIEYVHDPLGRRIAKIVDGVTVEKYLWQGLTCLLAVYDGSNNLIMRFEYADDRMPVAMIRGGATYYLAYDQVGSLRVVADIAGNVVKRIDYDSFGNIINDTNSSFDMPFGFAGGLHDRDTGLARFGYRDYDPDIGRWTAKDPIFFAGGDSDLYGYVLSNPIVFIDPWGLCSRGETIGERVKWNINASGLPGIVQPSDGWERWITGQKPLEYIFWAPVWIIVNTEGIITGRDQYLPYRPFSPPTDWYKKHKPNTGYGIL